MEQSNLSKENISKVENIFQEGNNNFSVFYH